MIVALEEIRDLVAEAATALDADNPGWFHHIDKKRLNLMSLYDCIIGQSYIPKGGEYRFGRIVDGLTLSGEREAENAFGGWSDDPDNVVATEAWFNEIDRRLNEEELLS